MRFKGLPGMGVTHINFQGAFEPIAAKSKGFFPFISAFRLVVAESEGFFPFVSGVQP
ncbi:hypothetical protein M2105_002562 [Paenibacillus sp. PastF-1]|nr:hypothetical protein [Paenibacillus sp. PastF-2]MDF9848341.1 hypothetical protein [Paenibacillus sp. PastM-2]MDF9854705.1 hypothetical protein [Paenibacillus sp. PastF-1]MDH6479976.1 hypothetical protein [Paenibacillus sp. PastH-2]MDH6507410.1 hypothetical protein [Paenibacillus sp. PastM-3]